MSNAVANREAQAWDYRVAGRSWQQIADAMGFKSASAAAAAVRAWQRRAAYLVDVHNREEMLEQEMARLDVLQSAVWNDALQGDPVAVRAALDVIRTRMRLLGLELKPESTTTATVVIAGDTTSYVEALKAVGT